MLPPTTISDNVRRPHWPYNSWWNYDDDVDKSTQHFIEKLKGSGSPSMKSFLARLEKYINIDETELNSINTTIKGILEKALELLKSKYKLFKDCALIPAGSVAEGSKICKPDEFDFTVSLPKLSFLELFSKKRMRGDLECQELIELANDLQLCDAQTVLSHIQFILKGLMTASLVESMATGWKMEMTGCQMFDSKTADTYHFTRSDGFEVDADICFMIPFTKDQLRNAGKRYQPSEEIFKEDERVFALLPRASEMRFISSNIERRLLLKYDRNRIRVYRLVKGIAKLFLPKIVQRNRCDRCNESIIASFYFKNIVLFMIERYSDNIYWNEDEIGNRVIEVFQVLRYCMTNRSKMSFYSFPGNHFLESENNSFRPRHALLLTRIGIEVPKPGKGHCSEYLKQMMEESVFFDINEFLFQIYEKSPRKGNYLYNEDTMFEKILFRHEHDPLELKFDPNLSTPELLRTYKNATAGLGPHEEQEERCHKCFIPEEKEAITLYEGHDRAKQEIREYFRFLRENEWEYLDVIEMLTEMLFTLKAL